MGSRKPLLAGLAVPALAVAVAGVAAPAAAHPYHGDHGFSYDSPDYDVVASGLNNPRQLDFGRDGHLYVAEAGTGAYRSGQSHQSCLTGGEGGEVCFGLTGSVTEVGRDGWQRRVLTRLPSLASSYQEGTGGRPDVEPGTDAIGPSEFLMTGHRSYALLMGLGNNPNVRYRLPREGRLLGTLLEGRLDDSGHGHGHGHGHGTYEDSDYDGGSDGWGEDGYGKDGYGEDNGHGDGWYRVGYSEDPGYEWSSDSWSSDDWSSGGDAAFGWSSHGSASYGWRHHRRPRVIADLARFEKRANPVDPELDPDSNPTGMLRLGRFFVITDAGGNTLVGASRHGHVRLLATFPTTPDVPVPGDGTAPMQAVPTAVALGPDGALYVSQLTGFPFPAGGASIFKVSWDGTVTPYATGLTNVTDLAFGDDGTLYAVEIDADGIGSGSTTGALVRIPAGGDSSGDDTETVADDLDAPYAVALRHGKAYVTTGSESPGGGAVIRIPLR